MDRMIKRWSRVKDDDLCFCTHRGVAYQRNMNAGRIEYSDAYHDHYAALEGSAVGESLNSERVAMLARHAPVGSTVLDIGAGCGTFVKKALANGFSAKGFDIIPKTVELLKSIDAFSDNPDGFTAVTFWDSLEHIEEPESVLKRINRGAIVLVAIPIFDDLSDVRKSRHFKPGEHFYYWTAQGFIDWMSIYGLRLLETSTHETDAGRDSIGAFAFCKDLPDYSDHIDAYSQMHSTRFYGSSATELHLNSAAQVVAKLQPSSILDYGCGRGDLLAHFWLDGKRKIERYDPAIPKFRHIPQGRFDLILCTDVLEHIPMAAVDRVLAEIKDRGDRVFFTISTKLARAKMPDGSNAHCTLLTRDEWIRWIGEYFGKVREMAYPSEHELVLLAGPK